MPARTNRQIEQLVTALIDSFSTEEMEQLVYYALNEPLLAVAGGDTFTAQIYNLAVWAQRNHHLPVLLAAAVAARPKNAALRDLVGAFHSEWRNPSDSGNDDQGKSTNIVTDDRVNERLDRIVSELGLMRGEVSEVRGRLVRVEAQLERREAMPLNWNYLAIALVLAALIGLGTYWLGVLR